MSKSPKPQTEARVFSPQVIMRDPNFKGKKLPYLPGDDTRQKKYAAYLKSHIIVDIYKTNVRDFIARCMDALRIAAHPPNVIPVLNFHLRGGDGKFVKFIVGTHVKGVALDDGGWPVAISVHKFGLVKYKIFPVEQIPIETVFELKFVKRPETPPGTPASRPAAKYQSAEQKQATRRLDEERKEAEEEKKQQKLERELALQEAPEILPQDNTMLDLEKKTRRQQMFQKNTQGLTTLKMNPLDQMFKQPGYLHKATEIRYQNRLNNPNDRHLTWEQILIQEYVVHRNKALNTLTQRHKETLDQLRRENREAEESFDERERIAVEVALERVEALICPPHDKWQDLDDEDTLSNALVSCPECHTVQLQKQGMEYDDSGNGVWTCVAEGCVRVKNFLEEELGYTPDLNSYPTNANVARNTSATGNNNNNNNNNNNYNKNNNNNINNSYNNYNNTNNNNNNNGHNNNRNDNNNNNYNDANNGGSSERTTTTTTGIMNNGNNYNYNNNTNAASTSTSTSTNGRSSNGVTDIAPRSSHATSDDVAVMQNKNEVNSVTEEDYLHVAPIDSSHQDHDSQSQSQTRLQSQTQTQRQSHTQSQSQTQTQTPSQSQSHLRSPPLPSPPPSTMLHSTEENKSFEEGRPPIDFGNEEDDSDDDDVEENNYINSNNNNNNNNSSSNSNNNNNSSNKYNDDDDDNDDDDSDVDI